MDNPPTLSCPVLARAMLLGDKMLEAMDVTKDASPAPRKRRALLADDDRDMRRLLGWMLRREGMDVGEVGGGVELLDWIDRTAFPPWTTLFDVIVSDVRMPDLTAIEVLAAMRNTVSTTPVILVTAFGDAEIRREARELGVCAVLDKPLVRDDLRAALRRASQPRVGGVLHA